MMAIAAQQMGIGVSVLHPSADCSAAPVSDVCVGDWTKREDLLGWAEAVDVITLEHEFVAAADLDELVRRGTPVWPQGRSLECVQDKWLQRSHLQAAGLPVPQFRAVDSWADVQLAVAELGLPLVLKTRRMGYDGHGTAIARSHQELESIWARFCPPDMEPLGQLLAEEFVPFEQELAVMAIRRRNGDCRSYPVATTVQKNYVCDYTIAPAAIPRAVGEKAQEIAIAAVRAIESVGAIGVELFLTKSGDVLVNELAPRPHNSGHYTLNGCATNQFEQHVRAVLDLPLGSTELLVPAVAMANIFGTRQGANVSLPLDAALVPAGVYLHWYGKSAERPGRKMGHLNAIASSIDRARDAAIEARDALSRWRSRDNENAGDA